MTVIEVSRVHPEVQSPKRNNFIQNKEGRYIIQRIKYLIAFQLLLGINRLYLINCRSCAKYFCFTYNTILVISDVIVIIVAEIYSASQILFKNTVAIEYFLLAFSALFLQPKRLKSFFTKLQEFDEKMNIQGDIELTSPRHHFYGMITIILYNFIEQGFFIIYAIDGNDAKYTMYASYMGIIVHEVEIIFYSVLLGMVSKRLRVIKAHVAQIFSEVIDKQDSKNIDKLEELSKKADLDVSSLHKAYDLLYKCSRQLNSAMSFPVTVVLAASGLSTILILKNLFSAVQTERDPNTRNEIALKVIVIIGIGRCLKNILLLLFPCYFSNATKTQVDIIMAMLHDILNNKFKFDKVERRKLKAFSQLCRDNAFIYVLWGVVRLDMSLPLSYSSLCTTYLIIFVQFSKFID